MNAENPQKKNRIKSAVIIVATLVIGMVLGGLVTTRIARDRMDRIAALRSERGFTHFIERSIDYDSPEQQEQVEEILDRSAERMFEHLRSSRRQAMEILDSTRSELSEILSAEQMEQLEKKLRRHHRDRPMRPGPRDDDRPPPRGRRP